MTYLMFLNLLMAQNQEGPSAREICLQDTLSLQRMLAGSQCEWPKKKIKNTEMYGCAGALFECYTNGEMNLKFSVCTKTEMQSAGPITEKDKESYIEDQKEVCQQKKMNQINCVYGPEAVDGRPVGDGGVDCRVPLKKNFQGIQR